MVLTRSKMEKKIVLYANGGKGFGHISRSIAIADESLNLDPSTHVTIISPGLRKELVPDKSIHCCSLPLTFSPEHLHLIPQRDSLSSKSFQEQLLKFIEKIKPSVVSFDFLVLPLLIEKLSSIGAKLVLVLRQQNDGNMRLLGKNYWLERFDSILIPHEKLSGVFLKNFRGKLIFTGDIIRKKSGNSFHQIRQQFNIPPSAYWIVSSPGGGGYPSENKRLFNSLKKTIDNLKSQNREIIATFFEGAFSNSRPFLDLKSKIQRVPFSSDYVDVISAADLIVGFCGYNSGLEIKQSGVPAVIVPMPRRFDDQKTRAIALQSETKGNITICPSLDTLHKAVYDKVSEHVASARKYELNVHNNCSTDENVSNGACNAAETILNLGKTASPLWDKFNSQHAETNRLTMTDVIFVRQKKPISIYKSFEELLHNGSGSIKINFQTKAAAQSRHLELSKTLETIKKENLAIDFDIITAEESANSKIETFFDKPISRSLSEVNFRIVTSCNSKCCFCNHWKKTDSELSAISYNKASDIIRQSYEAGACKITFNGGEPTLHPKLAQMVRLCCKLGIQPKINTNAILLSRKEKSAELIDNGAQEFFISYHGSESISEKIRGIKDSAQQTLNAISIIKKLSSHVKVRTNTVISKKNYKYIYTIVRQIISTGADKITINLVDNLKDTDNSNLQLNLLDLKEFYFKLIPQCLNICAKNRIGIKINPMFSSIIKTVAQSSGSVDKKASQLLKALAQNSSQYEKELKFFSKGEYGTYFYSHERCSIPKENAYLMANGDVFPCLRSIGDITGKILGNLYSLTLDQIRSTPTWSNFAEMGGKHEMCMTCKNSFEFNFLKGGGGGKPAFAPCWEPVGLSSSVVDIFRAGIFC